MYMCALLAAFLWPNVALVDGSRLSDSGWSTGVSHLGAHLQTRPPDAWMRPLGNENPRTIVKGFDREREGTLTAALLAQGLHSRLIRVGIASNGSLTAALVKLQAGDRRSDLISLADLQEDVVRVIRTSFTTLPELGHLDCWAAVPSEREFTQFHRPVYSVSVDRAWVRDKLVGGVEVSSFLDRCGAIRADALLLQCAVDGPAAFDPSPLYGDVLDSQALRERWTEFGAQANTSGELRDIPRDGPVCAVTQGSKESGIVALTIDDGPHPLTTPLVLDLLRREGARATFFVVGENAEQFPELVRMIVRDGHEIGNHTYSHIALSGLNPRGVWSQLRGCDYAIRQACGVTPKLMRPPGGNCSELALRVANHLGYTTVFWTANTGDWAQHKREVIVANGLSRVQSGSIILMHQGDLWSLEALPDIIRGIHQAGLTVGTVSDAMGRQGPPLWDPLKLVALSRLAHVDQYETTTAARE